MTYEDIPDLRHCPMCGGEAHLRKNASKRFQVHCKKCRCCTIWTSKPLAIVAWYNNAATYENMKGGIKNGETA